MSGLGERNIVLIGYRGSGKTSVGRELARRLDRPFFDSDVLVEAREGRSIREMVEREGWPFFREREKAVIRRLAAKRNAVIATGGGAVLDPENAELLKSTGWVVLLTAAEEVLVRRIRADAASREQRPSFSGTEPSDASLLEETRVILSQRMPIYQALADLVIDGTAASTAEIVEEILRCFPCGE